MQSRKGQRGTDEERKRGTCIKTEANILQSSEPLAKFNAENKQVGASPIQSQGQKRCREEEKEEEDQSPQAKRRKLEDDAKLIKALKALLKSDTVREAHPKLKTLKWGSLQIKAKAADGTTSCTVETSTDNACTHSGIKHGSTLCRLRVSRDALHNLLMVQSECINPACNHVNEPGISIDWTLSSATKGATVKITMNEDRAGCKSSKPSKRIDMDEAGPVLVAIDALFPPDVKVDVEFPREPINPQFLTDTLQIKYERDDEATFVGLAKKAVNFSAQAKTVCVKSGCGTGKSDAAVKILEGARALPCPVGKSGVLSLVSRQSLARTQTTKFSRLEADAKSSGRGNGLHMECYLDKAAATLHDWKNLIISPDSTVHLHGGPEHRRLRIPQVLWLDEFVPFLRYIAMSDTLVGKRKRVWDTVKHLIQQAEYCLITDADLSDADMEVIAKLRDPKTTVLHHFTTKNGNAKQYLMLPSFHHGKFEMIQDLKAGKQLYITCDTKKEVQALKSFFEQKHPGVKVLVYHGDSSPAHKATIADCDNLWTRYDVVIASPTVTYGVDFNPEKPHFHKTYAFFKGTTVDDQSAFQMLERARKLIDNHVVICLEGFHKLGNSMGTKRVERVLADLQTDFVKNVDELLRVRAEAEETTMDTTEDESKTKQVKQESKGIKKKDPMQRLTDEVKSMINFTFQDGLYQPDLSDPFVLIVRNTMVSRDTAFVNFATWLAARICYSGGTLRVESARTMLERQDSHGEEIGLVQTQVAVAGTAAKRSEAKQVAEAPLISEAEYKQLRVKKHADDSDGHKMTKYELVDFYGRENKIDAAFVEEYAAKEVMQQHKNLLLYARADHLQTEDTIKAALDTFVWRKKHVLDASIKYAERFAMLNQMLKLLDVEFGSPFEAGDAKRQFAGEAQNEIRSIRGKLRSVFGSAARGRSKSMTRPWFVRDLEKVCKVLFPKDVLQGPDAEGLYHWSLKGPLKLLKAQLPAQGDLQPWAQGNGEE